MAGIIEYQFKVGDRVDALGGSIFKNGIIKSIYIEKTEGMTKTMCNVLFDGHLWQKRGINSLVPSKDFYP
jgi:hypothetical protein